MMPARFVKEATIGEEMAHYGAKLFRRANRADNSEQNAEINREIERRKRRLAEYMSIMYGDVRSVSYQ